MGIEGVRRGRLIWESWCGASRRKRRQSNGENQAGGGGGRGGDGGDEEAVKGIEGEGWDSKSREVYLGLRMRMMKQRG